MRRARRLLLIFTIPLSALAQEDSTLQTLSVQRYMYKLGNATITIRKTTAGSAGAWHFIQLHDDENTAEAAATHFLQRYGGTLLTIENTDERFIHFKQNRNHYLFDPNRMFTATGVRQNLTLFKSYSAAAAKAIEGFRNFLLRLIPDTALIVAVHNNTNDSYTIARYKTRKSLRAGTANVHINPIQDNDDFFITTDRIIFQKLMQAGYNAVLQNNKTVQDDGSLSFYCGKLNRRYINVEAQAGHLLQQQDMLQVLKKICNQPQ